MSRRIVFWSYFLLITGLFVLVPYSFPTLSTHEYASLLFSYKERPLLLMLFSIADVLFDYVSLNIPQTELSMMRNLLLIRRPAVTSLYAAEFWLIVPYVGPFVLSKLLIVTVSGQAVCWVWIGLYALVWLALLLIGVHKPIANFSIISLLGFIVIRMIAYIWV